MDGEWQNTALMVRMYSRHVYGRQMIKCSPWYVWSTCLRTINDKMRQPWYVQLTRLQMVSDKMQRPWYVRSTRVQTANDKMGYCK